MIFAALVSAFYVSYVVVFAKGPQVGPWNDYIYGDPNNITVVISRNFEGTTLKTVKVPYAERMTALDALKLAADVDEGGGFVEAIDGLRGESTPLTTGEGGGTDWLYYINGIFATVYVIFYEMHPGDVMRWDYRPWVLDRMHGAVACDLFAGFTFGYRGTDLGGIWPNYIVDCGGFAEEAKQLQEMFTEMNIGAEVKLYDELTDVEKKKANLFLVGTFDTAPMKWVNDNYGGIGLFFHYGGSKVSLYSPLDDEITRTLDHCGLIVASKNPWNPLGLSNAMNLGWMATGVTRADVQAAIDMLIADPHVLADKYGGAAVVGNQFYEVY